MNVEQNKKIKKEILEKLYEIGNKNNMKELELIVENSFQTLQDHQEEISKNVHYKAIELPFEILEDYSGSKKEIISSNQQSLHSENLYFRQEPEESISLFNQNSQLVSKLHYLEKQIKQLKKDAQNKVENSPETPPNVGELSNQINSLRDSNKQLQLETSRQQKTEKLFFQKLKEKKERKKELKKELFHTKEKYGILIKQLNLITGNITHSQEESQLIIKLQKKMKKLQDLVSINEENNKTLRLKIQTEYKQKLLLEKEKVNKKIEFENLNKKCLELLEAKKNYEEKIIFLENQISKLSGKSSNTESQSTENSLIAMLKSKLSQANKIIEEKNQIISSLSKNKLSNLKLEVDEMQLKLDQMNTGNDDLKKDPKN